VGGTAAAEETLQEERKKERKKGLVPLDSNARISPIGFTSFEDGSSPCMLED
jgi:hypothetical protein